MSSGGAGLLADKADAFSNFGSLIPHHLRPQPVLRSVNERSLDLNALNVKKKLLEGMLS